MWACAMRLDHVGDLAVGLDLVTAARTAAASGGRDPPPSVSRREPNPEAGKSINQLCAESTNRHDDGHRIHVTGGDGQPLTHRSATTEAMARSGLERASAGTACFSPQEEIDATTLLVTGKDPGSPGSRRG